MPQPDAFIVTVVDTPAREVTLTDVLFGSLGMVSALAVLALALGGLLSLLLLAWHKRHPPETDHMPPVSPFIPR